MRRLLVFITVALSALAVTATSSAQRAVHLNNVIDISNSFQSPLLSEACGFPVTVTVSGFLDVTLIYNDAGLVVRHIENTPAGRATFSSANGSFSSRRQRLRSSPTPAARRWARPRTSIPRGC
jgi:hypothetical protein